MFIYYYNINKFIVFACLTIFSSMTLAIIIAILYNCFTVVLIFNNYNYTQLCLMLKLMQTNFLSYPFIGVSS